MVLEEVLIVVPAGEEMEIAGGVRSAADTGAGGGEDRVTVTVWTALREEAVAATALVLLPAVRGAEAMVHCADPVAVPLAPRSVCQVTCALASAPDVVPLAAITALPFLHS